MKTFTNTPLALSLYGAIKHGSTKLKSNPCSYCPTSLVHFHGSDFGKCGKQLLYNLRLSKSEKEEIEESKDQMFFLDGHLHEKSIVDALRASGYKVTHRENDDSSEIKNIKKIPIPKQFQIDSSNQIPVTVICHTDGVINDEILLECKSVKSWAFKNHFSQGICPENYYGQIQAYLWAHNLKKGVLVCKHRETSEIAPIIEVHRDDEFIEAKLNSLASILVAYQLNLNIKRPYKDAKNSDCRFCHFKERCWNEK